MQIIAQLLLLLLLKALSSCLPLTSPAASLKILPLQVALRGKAAPGSARAQL
jgi:hypothetical protein